MSFTGAGGLADDQGIAQIGALINTNNYLKTNTYVVFFDCIVRDGICDDIAVTPLCGSNQKLSPLARVSPRTCRLLVGKRSEFEHSACAETHATTGDS
jgi:hypothetical protein